MIAELKLNYKTVLFTNTAAKSVRESGMIFEVEDATGQCWKGRKVILATGSRDSLPEIPGYEELWGTKMLAYTQKL
jgi:thioredoxin reductase